MKKEALNQEPMAEQITTTNDPEQVVRTEVLKMVQRLSRKMDNSFMGCGCFLIFSFVSIPFALWKQFIAEFWWVRALASLGTFALVAIVTSIVVFWLQEWFLKNAVNDFNRKFPLDSSERNFVLQLLKEVEKEDQDAASQLRKALAEKKG